MNQNKSTMPPAGNEKYCSGSKYNICFFVLMEKQDWIFILNLNKEIPIYHYLF